MSSYTSAPSASTRQHPHLPPHLSAPSGLGPSSSSSSSTSAAASPSPAIPIEPSDSRQHAYSFSQNLGGRRGSTDPLLHASLGAAVTANMHGGHGHGHGQGGQSPSAADSPFSSSRKRTAATMLDPAAAAAHVAAASSAASGNSGGSANASPSMASVGRFAPGSNGANSSSSGSANNAPATTLPPLGGTPDGEFAHTRQAWQRICARIGHLLTDFTHNNGLSRPHQANDAPH